MTPWFIGCGSSVSLAPMVAEVTLEGGTHVIAQRHVA